MNPDILGKTAGIAMFRVKRHFRPEIFSKLKPSDSEPLREGAGGYRGRT